MRTLRKFILTIDQFIYIKRLQNEKPKSPVVRIYTKHKLDEDLDVVRKKLKEMRNEFVKEITIYFDFQLKPGRASKSLQNYIKALRKYALVEEVISTPEFERAIADLVIMFSPLTPHVSEELWSGIAHYNDYLKEDSNYLLDKYCFEQNWPTLDNEHKYRIDLFMYNKKKSTFLKSILLPKEKLVQSNKDELYRLAEEEFNQLSLGSDHKKEFNVYDNIHAQLDVKFTSWKDDDD